MDSPSQNIERSSPSTDSKVCICLPTFNEAENIKQVITTLKKSTFDGFLFVVDGFSTDDTRKISEELGVPVYSRSHEGKGSAIQKALEIACEKEIEFLMYLDCDQTYSPNDIPKFLAELDKADLVIGVRPINEIQPLHRRIGNRIATGLINLSFTGNVQDSISGFKCLNVQKFRPLLKENSFVADAVICVLALRFNFQISHVPVQYTERVGRSKMGFIIGLKELMKLIAAVLNLR